MPSVSVIIPAYNHSGYIMEALDSVFSQTFSDFEVIVVNDGSPDGTAELLRPLSANGRIRYIEQANFGQAIARNNGLSAARGELIAFLDDDDLWPCDKLAWQVESLRLSQEAGLVFGRFDPVGDAASGPPVVQIQNRFYDWSDFVGSNPILSPGQVLFRRSVLQACGGFDATIWGADDWDLYLRLLGSTRFLGNERVALRYRWHQGSASQDSRRMRRNELRVLRRHFLPPTGRGTLTQWHLLRMGYANHYRWRLSQQGYRALARYEAIVLRALKVAGKVFGLEH